MLRYKQFVAESKRKMKGEDPCWDGYHMVGKKKKNGKEVPNCVPEETNLDEGLRHKLAALGVAASLAAGAAHGQDTRRITPGESENRFPNAQQTDVKKDTERKKTVTPPSKEYLHGVIKGEHSRPLFTKERAKELLKKHYDEDIQEEKTPAWQRKEGKNPEGGLNKAGIASYRADNPGSKLSLAVTTKPSKLKKGSKAANRRKSFCARMSGMKKRLTSAKTARDPDSRINKALRKWNC